MSTYLNSFQMPPDTGSGQPGAPPTLPDPAPPRPREAPRVSLEDQVDIFGADIVRGSRKSYRFDVDPHLLYKAVCLLSTGGLWIMDGRPVPPADVWSELRRVLWRAITEYPGRFVPGGDNIGASMQSLVSSGTLAPKLMAGFGFCAAGTSMFVRANERYRWLPSLLRNHTAGGTYTRETFNEAACAILDALANSSIAPIAKYVWAEGAAESYPRQPNRDRIGVEATDVSLYGYAQFVLKTGRRPAKVARPRDHHKRGQVFHTTSRDIVGLLNTLRVDMKTLSVKRNASPYNDFIPGFLDLWATWNDRDTRAAIIAFAGYRGKVTHVLWPSFDPTPVDFVETTDFAVTGLALIRADYRPPATQHVPTADALFPRFDHDSTQAASTMPPIPSVTLCGPDATSLARSTSARTTIGWRARLT